MTTSRYDMAYGRQGGRIVPAPKPTRPAVGDTATLHGHTVTVVELRALSRSLVRFTNGATLTVPDRSLH
jgi:hypothetical protein